MYTIKRNSDALVVYSNLIGLDVNADETQCMVMSLDRNVGRNHSSFEREEDFKYLGTTLTHNNSIQEKIKGRFKSGNACYHSVQNILSSSLLI